MKLKFWLSLLSFAMLAACAKKDDAPAGAAPTPPAVATTPNQGCNIPGQTNCNPQTYNQYQEYGWLAPQPYDWTNNNGRCGCPAGYIVTRNQNWGYGCVRTSAMHFGYASYRQPYVFFNFQGGIGYPGQYANQYPYGNQTQYGHPFQQYPQQQQQQYIPPAQNGQNMNIPQTAYQPAVSGLGNCSVNAASACDVRTPDSCGANATCRPVGGGSTMGLCTSGFGHDYYSDNCRIVRRNNYSYWSCGGSHYDYMQGGGGGYNPYAQPR